MRNCFISRYVEFRCRLPRKSAEAAVRIVRRPVLVPALSVALSAQSVLTKRLESIASNVANSSTIGFRGEQVNFEELLSSRQSSSLAFPSSGALALLPNSGSLIKTESNLDVAIKGDGWFSVETPSGRAFTRDGRFVVSPNGELITVRGDKVLDVGGAPLLIGPDGAAPKVAHDGMISQGTTQVGAIGLFKLDTQSSFSRLEGALIMSDLPAEPITNFARDGVQSGFLENSNVVPVTEISKLISLQRMFAIVSNGLESTEGNVDQTIKMLGPSS